MMKSPLHNPSFSIILNVFLKGQGPIYVPVCPSLDSVVAKEFVEFKIDVFSIKFGKLLCTVANYLI